MRKFAAIFLVSVFVLLGLSVVSAQDGMPKPGPEHAKLAYFVGKWTSEGELKPSSYGPAGKFTFTETCDWLTGNFALECRSDGQMSNLSVKGMSVMSYDPGEGKYVYFESNNMGENTYSKGTVEGDTWTWTNESQMNGKTLHSRFTLKRVDDNTATYKYEIGAGSDPLAIVMEGKQTRQK
jgi:Protein of unknown function (DUF1579)